MGWEVGGKLEREYPYVHIGLHMYTCCRKGVKAFNFLLMVGVVFPPSIVPEVKLW